MGFLHYFLISLIYISFANADLSPDNVILAINCGGDSFTDSKGVAWEKVILLIILNYS